MCRPQPVFPDSRYADGGSKRLTEALSASGRQPLATSESGRDSQPCAVVRREGRRGSERAADTHFCDVSHLLPTGGKRAPIGPSQGLWTGSGKGSRQPYVSPGPVLPGARNGP
ncbi:apolipoprotein N-acyltransferase [Streptomyces azureus]|uniref:Apolipoprotein N-acyltransferase n=1 Tax=Streptomyces azureus TaxID=146537 RepID=A0A0K8PM11_STRAJ|nr:apolipoprotein N-acyltransferase [Streptomyces azureus]